MLLVNALYAMSKMFQYIYQAFKKFEEYNLRLNVASLIAIMAFLEAVNSYKDALLSSETIWDILTALYQHSSLRVSFEGSKNNTST